MTRSKLGWAALALCVASAVGAQNSWTAVEQALGRTGAAMAGGVVRFSFPRRDLRVTVDGIQLRPAFALGSWVAFKRVDGGDAMIMGDLVLLESEINPVISALQAGGVEQSALHNHVLNETPHVMYLHMRGHGKEADLARTVRSALALTKTPMDTTPAQAGGPAATFSLDTAALAGALGYEGKVNGGVWQVGVPRAETIMELGVEVPPSMGMATAINFQPTDAGRALIAGDFVMTGGEVNRVIRALRANGIAITSIHSHMLEESPRLLFMHFWAHDDAIKLARGLAAALAETNSQKPTRKP